MLIAPLSIKPYPPYPYFYYNFEHIFVLDKSLFAQALTKFAPHLSSDELFGMVYEHL